MKRMASCLVLLLFVLAAALVYAHTSTDPDHILEDKDEVSFYKGNMRYGPFRLFVAHQNKFKGSKTIYLSSTHLVVQNTLTGLVWYNNHRSVLQNNSTVASAMSDPDYHFHILPDKSSGVAVDYETTGVPVTVGLVKQLRAITGPWTHLHVCFDNMSFCDDPHRYNSTVGMRNLKDEL
eukprot:GDKI01005337.1.p1 GENE.GDKI01005337.1~~GDKI01005337.1.p1  ORF type:complete len:178 (+),score=58.16 GDKI01005337.1:96-629(+)